jgi:hypothetical protein
MKTLPFLISLFTFHVLFQTDESGGFAREFILSFRVVSLNDWTINGRMSLFQILT